MQRRFLRNDNHEVARSDGESKKQAHFENPCADIGDTSVWSITVLARWCSVPAACGDQNQAGQHGQLGAFRLNGHHGPDRGHPIANRALEHCGGRLFWTCSLDDLFGYRCNPFRSAGTLITIVTVPGIHKKARKNDPCLSVTNGSIAPAVPAAPPSNT